MGSREIGSRVEMGAWWGLQRAGLCALSGVFVPSVRFTFSNRTVFFRLIR